MPDAITMTNGRAEMAYVGAKPWHGLGSELTRDASVDTWIQEAGMDWEIKRSFVRYTTDRGDTGEIKSFNDHVVLFRSDTKDALSIVSQKYHVVQPRDVLEFFRDLCEYNDFELETAGTLFGGKRFWALANVGEESYVRDKQDKIRGRLLLATACDGTMKTVAKFVAERVVCSNTLAIGLSERGASEVKVSHRSVFHPDRVKTNLGVVHEGFDKFMDDMNELAEVDLKTRDVEDLSIALFTKKSVDDARRVPKVERIELLDSRPFHMISALYFGAGKGSTLPGAAGTLFGWLNAVTEYTDHRAQARSDENRFNASLFGPGDAAKSRAYDIAKSFKK